MAAAAWTALFRSLRGKMAGAPPPPHRLLASRGLGSSPALSSGSSSSPLPKDPQTRGSEVVGNELDWAKAAFKETAPKAAYFLVLSSFVFVCGFLIPSLKRTKANLDAAAEERSKMMDEMKQSQQRMWALLYPKER